MTAAQRRAINRQNARKSTGPITPEGKERTRQNAIKHGLCADHLALIIEKAEDLQDELDGWIEQYQPEGPAEFALVEDIAICQLRLRRCRRREAAVVDLQVRAAYKHWNEAQEDKRDALIKWLATDPATAARELSRFGAGRRWMIDRWMSFARWIKRDGYCNVPALIDEAVRLLGGDPANYPKGPSLAYMFRVCCAGARPTVNPEFVAWLLGDKTIHPDYDAEHGRNMPDREFCRQVLLQIVAEEVEALEKEEKDWRADEQSDAAGACYRAQLPAEGKDTALALRYESQARSALHKALKELDRQQTERYAAEVESEADEPDTPPATVPVAARNEADTPPEPPPSAEPVSTCDASQDPHPDVPNAAAMPTQTRACNDHEDMPTKTWACHPPDMPVVPAEGADSPLA